MTIPRELASWFSARTRVRGEEYERARRVTIARHTDASLVAEVAGTLLYTVSVERRRDGRVTFSCDCPYATDSGEACKHVWATLLEADRTGVLARIVGEESATRGADAAAGRNGFGDEDDEDDDAELPPPRRPQIVQRPTDPTGAPVRGPKWRRELEQLRRGLLPVEPDANAVLPENKRLVYLVDVTAPYSQVEYYAAPEPLPLWLPVELAAQTARKDGGWGPPKRFSVRSERQLAALDVEDRDLLHALLGARLEFARHHASAREFGIPPSAFATTLRRMCDTGRCLVRLSPGDSEPGPLSWDASGPWELALTLVPAAADADGPRHVLAGVLRRGDERVPITEPALVVAGLAVLRRARPDVARAFVALHVPGMTGMDLVAALRKGTRIEVGDADLLPMLAELYQRPAAAVPPLELPAALGVEEVRSAPSVHLTMRPAPGLRWEAAKVEGVLAFDYDGVRVAADAPAAAVVHAEKRRLVHRDRAAEAAAAERLRQAGFRREVDYGAGQPSTRLPASRVPRVAAELAAEGWAVAVDGQLVRTAGEVSISVRSGVDWFDLHAVADFGGVSVALPKLLAALRRGERMVSLPDGSLGILPGEWLARYGLLEAVAEESEDGEMRFGRGQVALLDALLAALPEARPDETFDRVRDELGRFEGVVPVDAPEGFGGVLRPYQREGLGWLTALQRFGFGGCLADDMGLGKTVQALALLEMRRQAGSGPSLVVVPRSLVFNWKQEAARFTPQLRVLEHVGAQRRRALADTDGYDLLLTTYGTLRRDAAELAGVEFDYVILDEAQAIKNAGTATAKASRLLRGRHRLAMSGTPVENRLAELWSLFEFLNPGMLGAASVFQQLGKTAGADDVGPAPDGGDLALLARALRPFILRRTKEQVAPDLPPRVEQTLWVELDAAERKLYDELRDHYRASLLDRVATEGLGKSKIHVLEALLRLRQAACHPGLLDKARADEPSSKVEVLLERLEEIVAEGHKALVFSQFTSLLALVRTQLDKTGVVYEYLDGKTRDRQARVERFQTDPSCPLFLISLKAGGLGLNLTAADYVFLLDPWWNPAVEAQAIDRAHRIGQTRRVLATRLIARDTVEEKVLELQAAKRDLADAIVRADDSLVGMMSREDLELLLG